MAVDLVRIYVVANVLLALAAALLAVARRVSARLRRPMSFGHQLHLGCALLGAALIGSWLTLPSAGADLLPAVTQVWAAPSMSTVAVSAGAMARATISAGTSAQSVPFEWLSGVVAVACVVGFALGLGRLVVGARSVRRVLGRAQLIRCSGSLKILSSDDVGVPFACWVPRVHYIVVPSSLILRPRDLRIALRHEAQHHRQADTRLVYALEFLRGLFFFNPAIPALLRQIRELQEFACDEALINGGRVAPREYCECLVRVARNPAAARSPISCLPMADAQGRSMLSRRVSAALSGFTEPAENWKLVTLNAFAVLALLATGIGLSGSIHDRRVSLAQAREMAAVARSGSSFPIVVNEQVVMELNRLLGTPDGRAFLRAGLRRMGDHEKLIAARLAEHGLPPELLAVPLVESGYRNLPQSANPRHGAGIWMFIEPTAHRFGLAVDARQDERLDVASETEAAMRLFSTLHSEFGDWGFAVLAYNGGRDLVHRAVRDAGAPDAYWAAGRGYENDPGYLARVAAAVILLKNKQRLQLDPATSGLQ